MEGAFGGSFGTVEILRAGTCHGYDWTLEWITIPGDVELLQVNSMTLTGPNPTVNVETIQDGGMVYGPLTGDLLQLQKSSPQVS